MRIKTEKNDSQTAPNRENIADIGAAASGGRANSGASASGGRVNSGASASGSRAYSDEIKSGSVDNRNRFDDTGSAGKASGSQSSDAEAVDTDSCGERGQTENRDDRGQADDCDERGQEEAGMNKPECNEELKPEDEALNIRYMRLAADFQNYRRRSEKDKSEIYAYANEKIVGSLLDIMDNFERALEHSDTSLENFCKGMELIFKQLTDVLMKYDVEEIKITPEQEFDTALHEAVMMEEKPAPDIGASTEVLRVAEVFKKGYMLKDKVIRHAAVKVIKEYI